MIKMQVKNSIVRNTYSFWQDTYGITYVPQVLVGGGGGAQWAKIQKFLQNLKVLDFIFFVFSVQNF
jgi:hypothetical protein